MSSGYRRGKNAAKVQKVRKRQSQKTHSARKKVARKRHQQAYENGYFQKRNRKSRTFFRGRTDRSVVYELAAADPFLVAPVFTELQPHHQANMHPVRYRTR